MPQISHALTLHLHQPPQNLQLLIDTNPKEAEQIIHCYDRITRFAHKYANIAHFHVAFSGLLLQQLQQPEIIEQYHQYIDIPAMLESYRLAKNIELIGVGMYHPIFPLIHPDDWATQLQLESDLMKKVFGRAPRGFLPPEMAFSMPMIPALVNAGYEYVLIDASCVHPKHEHVDIFQPYIARYQNSHITIIPISRDISYAQQTGLDPVWFAHEVKYQVQHSANPKAPRLLSTWSNGENKRWFRLEEQGFFGRFVAPYMEHAENGEYPILPTSISDYLKQNPASMTAQIETGAWNTGSTSGYGLADWGGSDAQREAIAKMRALKQRYQILSTITGVDADKLETMKQQMLIAQSSCFLFWGDEWIQKLFNFLQPIEQQLAALEAIHLEPATPQAEKPIPVVTPQPLVLPKKTEKKTTLQQPIRPHSEPSQPATVDKVPNKPVKPDAPTVPSAQSATASVKPAQPTKQPSDTPKKRNQPVRPQVTPATQQTAKTKTEQVTTKPTTARQTNAAPTSTQPSSSTEGTTTRKRRKTTTRKTNKS